MDVTGHLGRHDVKEEVGLMDDRTAAEKRKVDDFSSLYSLDSQGQPQAPVSHAPSSVTPPRSLQEHTSKDFIYYSIIIPQITVVCIGNNQSFDKVVTIKKYPLCSH